MEAGDGARGQAKAAGASASAQARPPPRVVESRPTILRVKRKRGGEVLSQILLPADAPGEVSRAAKRARKGERAEESGSSELSALLAATGVGSKSDKGKHIAGGRSRQMPTREERRARAAGSSSGGRVFVFQRVGTMGGRSAGANAELVQDVLERVKRRRKQRIATMKRLRRERSGGIQSKEESSEGGGAEGLGRKGGGGGGS